MMNNPYLIILADDHVLIRRGLRKIIEERPELKVVAEVRDGLELLDYLRTNSLVPDMLITDISMPNMGGIEATKKVKENYPKIKVLILTMHDRKEYLDAALAAEADGYLLKHEADLELFSAITAIRFENRDLG